MEGLLWIWRVAWVGDVEQVENALLSGISVNIKWKKKRDNRAKKEEDEFELQEAIVGRTDGREKDMAGITPLHCAAAGGHLEIVELLLSQKGLFNSSVVPNPLFCVRLIIHSFFPLV